MLTIETAAEYVDSKIGKRLTRDEGREMNMDGVAVVSFLLTDENGDDYGSFEVWEQPDGSLYGEY